MNDANLKAINRVIISLGSNIDKEINLPAAVRLLRESGRIIAVSPVYETVPIGSPNDAEWPRFWNAAVLMETDLTAKAFRTQVLDYVERKLKRQRTIDRFAPRTIDADLILFNQEILELDPDHHLPDPDLLVYAHVAIPVADVVPHLIHPETMESMLQIARRLMKDLDEKDQPLPQKLPISLPAASGKGRLRRYG